ncbi:MAG: glycogen-binding domain-containing protein, partial [Candidatus Krumholzibacteria bacterium]|nr:glycogen-binding domain-containing protein [Candidatus Krumholzibacteria bacterium]
MRGRACAYRLTALVALALAALPAAPDAAVRVDQDEVIFTLQAPGAKDVYLVGDFNQWNPTVEPMDRDGDRFEVGLFLVAGNYRYKFVVDGETITDPDNPGRSPDKGSPLSLVER